MMLSGDLAEIRAAPSIFALIERAAQRFPLRKALIAEEGAQILFGDLLAYLNTFQAQLSARNVGPESRVAIVLRNGIDMAAVLLATTCSAVAVPLNPNNSPAEFHAYCEDLGITHLLVSASSPAAARQVAAERGIAVLDVGADRLLRDDGGATADHARMPRPGRDGTALILLTSGSTGRPKKVPLSHGNICVSVGDICETLHLSQQDICLCMWEQFHIGGLVDLLLAPLAAGGSVLCAGNFESDTFFRLMNSHAPTWFQGVPATLYPLSVRARSLGSARFPALRFIRSVASALDPGLMREVEDLFGVPVLQTFGMTEAAPLITTNRLPPAIRKPGSVGRSCGPEIRIETPAGEVLPAGEIGEVLIRGPNVFAGYEDNPDANAASFRNGWFRTGDTGFLDTDGDLFLRGRIKETINRGGEKIGPFEVEEALLSHPAIAQAAVFAVWHRTLGEDIAAAVVPKPGQQLDITALRQFLFTVVAPFKVPARILFRESLPLNPVGKIDKLRLAQEVDQTNRKSEEKSDYRMPRHQLDKFLVALWARELDLDPQSVGIDDNFAYLGGDSLSSLRILHFIEESFKVTIPEAAALGFLTVRDMSDGLDELGVSPYALERGTAPGLEAGEGAPAVWIDDLVADSRQRLKTAGGKTGQEIIRKDILTLATLDELAKIYPLQYIFKKKKGDWRRIQISDYVWKYSSKNEQPGKSVIFAFTGNLGVLMLPIHIILSCIDSDKYDLVLLKDINRQHYEAGLGGIGAGPQAVFGYLEAFRRAGGYETAIAIGTSAGGLAAIAAALTHNWRAALAVAPDTPESHPVLKSLILDNLPHGQGGKTAVTVALAAGRDRDVASARDLQPVLPHGQFHVDDRFASHNFLDELFLRQELAPFLARFLGSFRV